MHTIKPIDKEAILAAVNDTRRIITAEDHTVIGGLGSAVAEVVIEAGKACAFRKLGLQDKFSKIGLHEDLMAMHEIDAEGIVKTLLKSSIRTSKKKASKALPSKRNPQKSAQPSNLLRRAQTG